jgi:transposase
MKKASPAVVRPEEAVAERSETTVGGGRTTAAPDPEVPEKATRRTFTAEYKLRILREVDACKEEGEVGAVLRREGLYSSHLTTWRRQREAGELQGLTPRKRGRRNKKAKVSTKEVDQLRRENARLKRELEQARLIIDIQKKASEMLGIPLRSLDDEGND